MSEHRHISSASAVKLWNRKCLLLLSPDGGYVAGGSADGALYIWNVLTGKVDRTLERNHKSVAAAVVKPFLPEVR